MIDVVSGVGGGAELDLLEIRFLELVDVVDYFVVAESAFNFRGDTKPRLFDKNKGRFEAFLPRIVYLDLDACRPYRSAVDKFRRKSPDQKQQNVWDIQSAQRNCIWTLLKRHKNISSDTLVIHTDLDEIPTAEAMWSLRNCKWSDPGPTVKYHDIVQLHLLALLYNLRTLQSVPSDNWVQGTVRKFSRITVNPLYWSEDYSRSCCAACSSAGLCRALWQLGDLLRDVGVDAAAAGLHGFARDVVALLLLLVTPQLVEPRTTSLSSTVKVVVFPPLY
ncbi:unnamed protein product [Prorocentrum cordatum]|uniref:Beta-1,4-mannosyl-glycoprotein beta-1,4-N-acetylglucosaminyltransferase n=1 Tax=Prorocentrum cordatum TaxID=2364126 RepID=A0ABN9PXE9_9DINO|nr:unnamed protein product [Polarella glacialis]